jgi:hypothetical protein
LWCSVMLKVNYTVWEVKKKKETKDSYWMLKQIV